MYAVLLLGLVLVMVMVKVLFSCVVSMFLIGVLLICMFRVVVYCQCSVLFVLLL